MEAVVLAIGLVIEVIVALLGMAAGGATGIAAKLLAGMLGLLMLLQTLMTGWTLTYVVGGSMVSVPPDQVSIVFFGVFFVSIILMIAPTRSR